MEKNIYLPQVELMKAAKRLYMLGGRGPYHTPNPHEGENDGEGSGFENPFTSHANALIQKQREMELAKKTANLPTSSGSYNQEGADNMQKLTGEKVSDLNTTNTLLQHGVNLDTQYNPQPLPQMGMGGTFPRRLV